VNLARPAVLVVGDVMMDIVVKPEGPLVRGADRRATIRSFPGGSGANQAVWLAAEGVRVVFAGRAGRADHAEQSRLLSEAGVETALACDPDTPTGRIVSVLSPDGERSFFTDRGANDRLCRADLPDALLDRIDLVHVSAYPLFGAGPRAAVLGLLAEARRRGIPFSIDPASCSFLEEAGPERFLDWTGGARLAFPNAAEAAILTGEQAVDRQVEGLAQVYGTVVVKWGPEGAVAGDRTGRRWSAAAPAAEAVDTSGAGDAFLAGFVGAWLQGEDMDTCLHRGVQLGSRAVTFLGARPA
jgi:sugar/nucleoside kinase (ribokinase family)